MEIKKLGTQPSNKGLAEYSLDVSSRAAVEALVKTATALGEITGVIYAAGVSPSQAPVEAILEVDL